MKPHQEETVDLCQQTTENITYQKECIKGAQKRTGFFHGDNTTKARKICREKFKTIAPCETGINTCKEFYDIFSQKTSS